MTKAEILGICYALVSTHDNAQACAKWLNIEEAKVTAVQALYRKHKWAGSVMRIGEHVLEDIFGSTHDALSPCTGPIDLQTVLNAN